MSRNGKLVLSLFSIFIVCQIMALLFYYTGLLDSNIFWSSALVAPAIVLIGYPREMEKEKAISSGSQSMKLIKIGLISLICFETPAILCLVIFNISSLIMPFAVAALVTACFIAHWDHHQNDALMG